MSLEKQRLMDRETIAFNIRKIRISLGLTQEQMADMLGKGRTTYINFENGKTESVSKTIYDFAEVTGRLPEEVLLGPDFRERMEAELREGPDWNEMKRTLMEQHRKEIDEKDRCITYLTETLDATRKAISADTEAIRSLNSQVDMLKARLEELKTGGR